MFLSPLLSARRREARIKLQMAAVERQCDAIARRFEAIDRKPTHAERQKRVLDFLTRRRELGELDRRLARLKCW